MNRLPKFIKLYLLTFLDLTSLRNFSQTNKNNAELFRDNYIWKNRKHINHRGEPNYENYRETYSNIIVLHIAPDIDFFPKYFAIFGKYFIHFAKSVLPDGPVNKPFHLILYGHDYKYLIQFGFSKSKKTQYARPTLLIYTVNLDVFIDVHLERSIEFMKQINIS